MSRPLVENRNGRKADRSPHKEPILRMIDAIKLFPPFALMTFTSKEFYLYFKTRGSVKVTTEGYKSG
jgi:hypothetical protein